MVRRWLVAALAVSLLVAGPLAASASAEDAQTTAPKTHLHKKHAAKAKPEAAAPAAMATGDLPYPPCSRSLRDKCIELNQRDLNRAFPSCARSAGVQKAACIETAFKEQKPAQ